MSITKPLDGWDRNASQLLRRRILEGSPDKTVNYAPDSRYGSPAGPLTVQIDRILRQHAALWAQDMREHEQLGVSMDGKAAFLLHMREADAEIKRFIEGHRLATGAAA
jgi:hypothetical protein